MPELADRPARILIVDDDADAREVLGVILSWEGYVVLSAGTGEEALALASQEPPDLVLLDARMPGMDGFELAAALKSALSTQNVPILMITGLTDDASRRRGLLAGAQDFLAKPLGRAEVLLQVKAALGLGGEDLGDPDGT